MPVRQMSTYVKVDEERLRKIEQEGYNVLYTAEVQNYMDRKNTLETNLGRAYALILSTYCNGTMQHRIEEHPEFDSKIQNDPIELLKAIKIVMHNPIRAKYPYASAEVGVEDSIHFLCASGGTKSSVPPVPLLVLPELNIESHVSFDSLLPLR